MWVTRVAAIDCGTNSIRLLVADLPEEDSGKDLVDLTRRMEIVRLGQGVDRTGRLAPEAIERTRTALLGYAAEIAELGVSRVRMCATSASRDAANAADFTTMVRATLGVDPEVITGEEEARLSFAGAVTGLVADEPYLVVDIGGGSTEFVVGGADVEHAISVDIGCVRMTERHLHGDPPTPAEVAAAELDVTRAVDTALRKVSGHATATLVGLAGSITTVTAHALGLPEYRRERVNQAELPVQAVLDSCAALVEAPRAERAAMGFLHPGRVDVIAAGALVWSEVITRVVADVAAAGGSLTSVVTSEHDILDGIALSMA